MNLHYSSRGNSAGQVVNAGLIALANRELFRKAEKLEATPSRTGLLAGMIKGEKRRHPGPFEALWVLQLSFYVGSNWQGSRDNEIKAWC